MIDGHTHAISAGRRAAGPLAGDIAIPAACTVEDLLGTLDAHGVERAVVVGVAGDEPYLARCLRRHADRLTGIGLLRPESTADPLEELRRQVGDTGVRGVRLRGLGPAPERGIEESPLFPLLRHLEESGLPLWLLAQDARDETLPRVLAALPRLTVVLNHFGAAAPGAPAPGSRPGVPRLACVGAAEIARTRLLARYPNVHVLLSGQYAVSADDPPYADLAAAARSLHEAYGTRRLIWGSDFPFVAGAAYAPQRDWVDLALPHLPAPERAAVLGGNVARLFPG
ncbi:hydrolase [Streptosporangium violaceochromogenes]|nr:hydrolase [Streptosporangium violaceochromogenes]